MRPVTETNIQLTVNGETERVAANTTQTLLHVLREALGLTGTKDGCASGDCGACVVLLDGRAVNSCMVLAPQADGSQVTTIEGLAGNGDLHPLQRAFSETWAFQCGFCTPGMLMTSYEFVKENSDPTEEEVRKTISGVLCRCTGYKQVIDSVMAAADAMRGR